MLSRESVDRLIDLLVVRYAQLWFRMYEGIDTALVNSDWAAQVRPLTAEQVQWGYDNLPTDRVPTSTQFRAICLSMPAKPAPKELPPPPASPEEMARRSKILADLKALELGQSRKKVLAQIKDFRARAEAGERLSFAQRDWLAAVADLENDLTMPGDFKPIAVDALPTAMRPDAHTIAPDPEAP